MGEATFRSDIKVEAVPDLSCGSDRMVAHAAWVVPDGKDDTAPGWRRVIRAMMRERHTSPFEQGRMTVRVEAPGVVWWQWTRHRFMAMGGEDHAFNVESGRYRVLDGVFYVPPEGRPIQEPEGFNPLRPKLDVSADLARLTAAGIKDSAGYCWAWYEAATAAGVAREVARLCLPNWALYCAGYVGGGPLTWLQFFGKRKAGGVVPTHPQHEIAEATRQCEDIFKARWPITYEAFCEFGRVSP